MRGEQRILQCYGIERFGSSPRARGTGRLLPVPCCSSRFIPACAGNRFSEELGTQASTVHPRVRGEQERGIDRVFAGCGSSPRARGTDRQNRRNHMPLRFIPACAGNSFDLTNPTHWMPVHPRVRGEQIAAMRAFVASRGSSPRARGTVARGMRAREVHRFIPACAGNRISLTSPATPVTVHPRVRGEQYQCFGTRFAPIGSSPRARGTAAAQNCADHRARFIPACAGNRPTSASTRGSKAVHPRVRGEQILNLATSLADSGSSPRARGTDRRGIRTMSASRFIPACAGNRLAAPEHSK